MERAFAASELVSAPARVGDAAQAVRGEGTVKETWRGEGGAITNGGGKEGRVAGEGQAVGRGVSQETEMIAVL